MAIEKVVAKRTLGIYVKDGVKADGTDKLKAHNYGGVKDTATDEDSFAVGQSRSTLMAKDLVEVAITDRATLTQGM